MKNLHIDGGTMKGFELRLWRKGMDWTQERAAEELGVNLRTYVSWEKKGCSRLVDLATSQLSLRAVWPDAATILKRISTIARH